MPALANHPTLLEGASRDHAVLLVHGLGGGPYEVQRLAESLHGEHGLTTQTTRLPGHEGRSWRMPSSTWEAWCAAVEHEYHLLAARFARVDLVGFSTGCPILLHVVAERRIDVGRLVLLAPFVRVYRPPLMPVAPQVLVRALTFLKTVPRRGPPLRDPAVRRDVERCSSYRTFDLEATRSALALIDRVMGELAEVKLPTLIVQGRRDSVVDLTGAESVHAGLGGPKRLVWMDDSDHLLTLDRDAPRVNREVGEFLLRDAEPA